MLASLASFGAAADATMSAMTTTWEAGAVAVLNTVPGDETRARGTRCLATPREVV